jgi:hypothetical protein
MVSLKAVMPWLATTEEATTSHGRARDGTGADRRGGADGGSPEKT